MWCLAGSLRVLRLDVAQDKCQGSSSSHSTDEHKDLNIAQDLRTSVHIYFHGTVTTGLAGEPSLGFTCMSSVLKDNFLTRKEIVFPNK